MLSLARKAVRPAVATMPRARAGAARRMGGAHPGIQEPGGKLFMETPPPAGKSRVIADWEPGYWATCVIGLAFGVLVLPNRPDTSIKTWSENEAKARIAAGVEEPEVGTTYQINASTSYVKEAVGAPIVLSSGDDDE